MTRRILVFLLAGATLMWLVPLGAGASSALWQQPPPIQSGTAAEAIARIRDEGLNRSQVTATVTHLTDVIGPRLTGSPNLKRANEWTRATLASWGVPSTRLEAWGTFGRGWSLKRFSAQIVEPQCVPLVAWPRAWSPGLKRPLTAEVIWLDVKDAAGLERYRGALKGAIVLTEGPRELKALFDPPARRKSEKDLLDLADAVPSGAIGRRSLPADARSRQQLASAKARFLMQEEAAMIVEPSRSGDGGAVFIESASVPQGGADMDPPAGDRPAPRRIRAWDRDAPKILPQVVVAADQYNRLIRMVRAGERLRMGVEIQAEYHDEDPMGYNTIAEIPGTDLADEVVMLGAHLDSWHSGTGATDNAAGVTVVMEAMRILRTLQLPCRRTVRAALWTGEEQGLLGSRAYVAKHFGALEPPTGPPGARRVVTRPGYEKLSAYYNLDHGTGKIRGVYLQGNEAVRPLFRGWLTPFRDLGATTLSIVTRGQTDHVPFDEIGLPAFQFIQDEVEYFSRTHHSNHDVLDRIQMDDLKQASVVMAGFVYQTANLDQRLPRKPATVR